MIKFKIIFQSIEQFYDVVRMLNIYYEKSWTIDGRVLKYLKFGKSVERNIIIFSDDIHPNILELFLEQ
jgi:hypothetical protein